MKLAMDADCLIKLTKAGLKGTVCSEFTVVVPRAVKKEVVDNAKDHPDSRIIQDNIAKGLVAASETQKTPHKGEEAVLALFGDGGFDRVCSDDKRFIRDLRTRGIPYLTPAVLILSLARRGSLELPAAYEKLDALAPFISDDEYAVVRLNLDYLRSSQVRGTE